jgi:hypothetical protein
LRSGQRTIYVFVEKKIPGISEVRDESDREGMRIVGNKLRDREVDAYAQKLVEAVALAVKTSDVGDKKNAPGHTRLLPETVCGLPRQRPADPNTELPLGLRAPGA